MKLKNKHIISGKLKVLTGLHIGGTKEAFQIGEVDNPMIKLKRFGEDIMEPYIPGSSLKGKIRCLLERELGKEKPCDCGDCNICILFGPHQSKNIKYPSVLIFRDAYLSEECRKKDVLKSILEIKTENIINRAKGTSDNLRQTERIIPGTIFDVEIVINEYEGMDIRKLLETLKRGFNLLQNDYLGGSGTRGYGKVDVSEIIQKIDELIKKF